MDLSPRYTEDCRSITIETPAGPLTMNAEEVSEAIRELAKIRCVL